MPWVLITMVPPNSRIERQFLLLKDLETIRRGTPLSSSVKRPPPTVRRRTHLDDSYKHPAVLLFGSCG